MTDPRVARLISLVHETAAAQGVALGPASSKDGCLAFSVNGASASSRLADVAMAAAAATGRVCSVGTLEDGTIAIVMIPWLKRGPKSKWKLMREPTCRLISRNEAGETDVRVVSVYSVTPPEADRPAVCLLEILHAAGLTAFDGVVVDTTDGIKVMDSEKRLVELYYEDGVYNGRRVMDPGFYPIEAKV
jgi:hypothetical protein